MWIPLSILVFSITLMKLPAVLGFSDLASGNAARALGALTASFAVLSLADALVITRWVCAFFALITTFAPLWIWLELDETNASADVAMMICGIMILGLSLLKRKTRLENGGGWRTVFRPSWTEITWTFR